MSDSRQPSQDHTFKEINYRCIVADPPWMYRHKVTGRGGRCSAHKNYPTMTTDEICAMEPPAATGAHLYLWTTYGHLIEGDAVRVCKAWGFKPMQLLTWCKPGIGMGYYFRSSSEHVLFGVRGGLQPQLRNVPTVFHAPRPKFIRGEFTRKPDILLEIAEKMTPGPRLEIFARRSREGWDAYGNELEATYERAT